MHGRSLTDYMLGVHRDFWSAFSAKPNRPKFSGPSPGMLAGRRDSWNSKCVKGPGLYCRSRGSTYLARIRLLFGSTVSPASKLPE